MPPNFKCIQYKWAFDIKCYGVYHTRLIACAYSQVAGVDSSKNYLPVENNIMFRLLLLIMIHFGFAAKVVDIEIAFLMECPSGMKNMKG